jgi:hypothetical protein
MYILGAFNIAAIIIRQIKENEVGGTCGTHGRGQKSQKERDHLEDQSVDGRMGSELILGKLAAGV